MIPQSIDEDLIDQKNSQFPTDITEVPIMHIFHSLSMKVTEEVDFFENIAKDIPEEKLRIIGSQLKELYENDKEANQNRIDIIEQGIKALGLTKTSDQADDDSFINPAYLTSYLALAAECSTELFPPNNIVQAAVKSINTNPSPAIPPEYQNQNPNEMQQDQILQQQMQQQATQKTQAESDQISDIYRKALFAADDLNYKFDDEWADIIEEVEKTINQCFITGSSTILVEYDKLLGRPSVTTLPAEQIFINAEATNLKSATRISYVREVPEKQLRDYIHSGYFLPFDDYGVPDEINNDSSLKDVLNEISGVTPISNPSFKYEYVYKFVTTQIYISLDEMADNLNVKNEKIKHRLLPYSITFHEESGKVVRIERQWDPKDDRCLKIHNLIDFKFLPGIGPFGIGLAHMAVPLARIATQLHRELVKSARIANFPGAMIKSDVRIDQTNPMLQPYQLTKVTTSESLQDVVMQNPFNPPSDMLLQILRDFETAIKNIAGITALKMENLPSNIKSSALLAILEKEIKPQSAVMRRLQKSFNHLLQILQRILAKNMGKEKFGATDTYLDGRILTNEEVYGAPIKVRSSADPNLTNSTAQMIRNQAILDWAQSAPDLHKMPEIYRRIYTSMRLENIDSILKTNQELQQEAMAAQQQAAQTPTEVQVLMADIEQKSNAATQRAQLDQMKLQAKTETEKLKIMQDAQAKQQEFENQLKEDEIEKFKVINKVLLDKQKLEAETGIPIQLWQDSNL